ncbi:hypothetical protein BN2476_610015 [Paraburkholderia piptadeniae]|uniref:Uncharacterized protein n=1 Tax=Paraburkholderia piptadeniae TaxID=1701573 RepID=A0A1N7SKQ2_9BURK|nr:hypothetical protein BN2476_610015 [Paraburkholderia piptadeniae]
MCISLSRRAGRIDLLVREKGVNGGGPVRTVRDGRYCSCRDSRHSELCSLKSDVNRCRVEHEGEAARRDEQFRLLIGGQRGTVAWPAQFGPCRVIRPDRPTDIDASGPHA